MSVKEEGRGRVKSILIPLIHTSAVLPTGVYTCTHVGSKHWSDILLFVVQHTNRLSGRPFNDFSTLCAKCMVVRPV